MNIKQNDTILHIILLINDLIGSLISLSLAFFVRYKVAFGVNAKYDQIEMVVLFLLAEAIVNVLITPVVKYTRRGTFAELLDVVKRQAVASILVIVFLYFSHSSSNLSRLVVGYYASISCIVIWTLRLLVKWFLNNKVAYSSSASRILIVSTSERKQKVMENIVEYNDFGRNVCDFIEVEKDGFKGALEYATHNTVDEVFVSLPKITDRAEYEKFLTELVNMGVKLDIDINQFELDIPGHKIIDQVGHYAVVSIARNTVSISRRVMKRAFDFIGGLIGCVLTIPVALVLIPVIKLDSAGPAIFSQKRVGKNGRVFTFYKFRSMYVDAEERKKELMDQNDVNGLMFKMEEDPRITKVGKIIRKTSLDELPQFYNVLIGDMSLVGTRPPTLDEYERYEPWQKARLSMKPGITGLWQVSGRSEIKDFDEVVKLDMKYIDNWSFALDVKILLKTVGVVFTRKGSK